MKTTTKINAHVTAIEANVTAYYNGETYEAFTARQKALWDAVARDGAHVERSVARRVARSSSGA